MASLQNVRVIAVARAELGKLGCIGVTLLLPWLAADRLMPSPLNDRKTRRSLSALITLLTHITLLTQRS